MNGHKALIDSDKLIEQQFHCTSRVAVLLYSCSIDTWTMFIHLFSKHDSIGFATEPVTNKI
jgi:hypothetical protein